MIRLLGPAVMERLSLRNRPFLTTGLTTGALFRLAANGAEAKRTAYGTGPPEERRGVLDGLAGTTPALPVRPAAQGDVAGRRMVPKPLVAVEGRRWIGYKGGSEFGVLNLSAAGITADGRPVCAVLTANGDRPQPEDRLALLFSTLFRSVEKNR